jgi:CDP-paratose 2-epimerase
MNVLVTGSSGLIGSEAVVFFDGLGFPVTGLDNNMRADFFGPQGDTTPTRRRLERTCCSYRHLDLDIRDRAALEDLIRRSGFDLVIHAAAQPSHDLAARRPFDDFDVNAVGTMNLLEACRRHRPDAVFVFLSTNKVYGDAPNRIRLKELPTRWEFDDPRFEDGISEELSIDQSLHSLFGASKVAADVMVQEYGRYFGMKTGIFRGGCLTGPQHAGVELHGFLNYLVRAALGESEYTIYGHKGKQVRDQIHSRDVVSALWHFAQDPRPGEVYNLGGGKENAASLIECVDLIERVCGRRPRLKMSQTPRRGDHICYYSNLHKLRAHYPGWRPSYGLEQIVKESVTELSRSMAAAS